MVKESQCPDESGGVQGYSRPDYLKERRLLIDLERESTFHFDKTILTLSAGALGLSLVLVRDIAPDPLVGTLRLLALAWGFFGLSLLSVLLSFLLSQAAIRKQRQTLDSDYEGNTDARAVGNPLASCTGYVNWASMGLFFLGVFFLAWFSIRNLMV